MRSNLNEIALVLIELCKRLIGTVQLIHTLFHHAFHHLVEAVQVIVEAGILQRDGRLDGERVRQQNVILIKGCGRASAEREHAHHFIL